jgi:hypothetical protein
MSGQACHACMFVLLTIYGRRMADCPPLELRITILVLFVFADFPCHQNRQNFMGRIILQSVPICKLGYI